MHPKLKRKGTSKLVLVFYENITTWLGLITGTRGKPKRHDNYGRKIRAIKSLLRSSSVNDLRIIDFELTSKRRSVVLTSKDLYEQFLAKKVHRNFLSESFFPSRITESGEQKWIALRYGLNIKMNQQISIIK